MAIYDINGKSLVSGSGENSTNINLGEISTTTKQEELDLFSNYPFYENNRLNTNGEIYVFDGWAVSEYIPINEKETICFGFTVKNITPGFWCYDSNKNPIALVSGNLSIIGETQNLITLDNTAYIRFSLSTGYVDKIKALVVKDITYYSFIDTTEKRWQINLEEIAQNTKISGLDALLYNYTKWKGKSLVTDGNSLVQSCDWGSHLANFLGMEHTNCGLSGSMLVPATWTMADIKANINDNYPNAVDLVILQGDTNGSMDGEPTDEMDGDEPKTTWMARMNYLIRCIKARFHNVVIVLMPDSVRYDNLEKNRISYSSMKKLAEYNRLAFFSVDCSTPWNPYDDNYYSRLGFGSGHTTQDSVHPFEPYNISKGYALAHFVAGLVFNPDAPNTATEDWEDTV